MINDWELLIDSMRGGCSVCPRKENLRDKVEFSGWSGSKVLFLTKEPGKGDVINGEYFSSKTVLGKIFNKYLFAINRSRDSVYIGALSMCPGGDLSSKCWDLFPLDLFKGKTVILLGSTVTKMFFDRDFLTLVDKSEYCSLLDCYFITLRHPLELVSRYRWDLDDYLKIFRREYYKIPVSYRI